MQNNPNLTYVEYVEWLRRYILVHSVIYYEENYNVISDSLYDSKSKELVEMQKGVDTRGSMYYNVFKDFDGSTGFDLIHKLSSEEAEYIRIIASHVIANHKKGKWKGLK